MKQNKIRQEMAIAKLQDLAAKREALAKLVRLL